MNTLALSLSVTTESRPENCLCPIKHVALFFNWHSRSSCYCKFLFPVCKWWWAGPFSLKKKVKTENFFSSGAIRFYIHRFKIHTSTLYSTVAWDSVRLEQNKEAQVITTVAVKMRGLNCAAVQNALYFPNKPHNITK